MPEASSALSRAPSPEEMVARARALKPALRERAEQCERDRRVPEATIAEMKDAELDRLMVPARYGGFEMGWDTLCEAAIELGKGCGSQAWVITIYGDHNHLIGNFAREAQDDVWGADPRALTSTCFQPLGTMRPRNGGYVVSGRWTFSSGIDHVQWILASAMLEEGAGPPGRVFFLAPKREATVIDDWHVAGLAGTGSKSFTMHDTFVPAHRILSEADHNDGTGPGTRINAPVYRFPRRGVGIGLAAVAVGAAWGMLDDFCSLARDRARRGRRAANDFSTALRIAESKADLDAARWSLIEAARATQAMLEETGGTDIERRATNRLKAGYAGLLACRTVDRLFAASGGTAIYSSSRLQRALRDVHAATQHTGVSWDLVGSPYGRLMLGEDPDAIVL